MQLHHWLLKNVLIITSAIVLASCQPAATPTQSSRNDDIQDVRVQTVEPVRATAKVESFPLPNCGGTDKLEQSLGTYASVSRSATVSDEATVMGGGEVGIPETIKLKLEIQVEHTYQQTFESASSRLDSIKMSAAAGTHVVYTIIWEEQTFNSVVQYLSNDQVYEAPYTYKLSAPKIDKSYNVACSETSLGNDSSRDTTEIQPATQPPSSSNSATVGRCPNTPEEAAGFFGGSPAYWKRLAGYEQYAWIYGPAPASPIEDFNIPEGMKGDWWDNFKAQSRIGPARVGYASEATIWCLP